MSSEMPIFDQKIEILYVKRKSKQVERFQSEITPSKTRKTPKKVTFLPLIFDIICLASEFRRQRNRTCSLEDGRRLLGKILVAEPRSIDISFILANRHGSRNGAQNRLLRLLSPPPSRQGRRQRQTQGFQWLALFGSFEAVCKGSRESVKRKKTHLFPSPF